MRQIRYRADLLVAGLYTLLTLILTYPVAFQLTSHIAGFAGEDNLQWRWFLWWFKHALLTRQSSVADVSLLYAPTGGEQPLYWITSFVPALALPVTLAGGATLSFNLSFLLSFALSGYTAYLLAYYVTHHRPAAFIAGLIFAFFPARFGYATGTFLGQITTYFLPLYVLSLFMLAHRPTLRRAIWAALVLALVCLTWPLHVAYGVVIFTPIFFIYQILTWLRRPETRSSLKYFALTFALTFGLIIGFYLPLLRTVEQGQGDFGADNVAAGFSVDVLAFISPSNHHPIWQPWGLLPDYATRVLTDDNDIQERLAYIGFIPLLLLALALLKCGRHLRFWWTTALVAMILSLGPLLKFKGGGGPLQINIEGYVGYIVLPYALFSSLPIISWSGVLGRLNTATMLCVGVMAAYGVSWVGGSRKREQLALVIFLSGLIVLEFLTLFPFRTEPDVVPAFYETLRQEALITPQKIIDFPLVGAPAYTNYAMHYQTVHQQPIAGGHFMRKPAGAREMTGFINQLLAPPLSQTVLSEPDPVARLAWLNKFGFTKIVARLHLMAHDEPAQKQLAHLAVWLGEPQPVGEVAVIEIPAASPSTQPVTALLAGVGWQPGAPSRGTASLHLQAPADVLLYVADSAVNPITLQLSLSAPTPDRYLSLDLNGRPVARLYLSQEVLHYKIPLALPTGTGAYQLTFRPEESCQQACAVVDFSRISIEDLTPPQDRPSLDFGGQVALVDYTVSSTRVKPGQPLLIYLYWQGEQPLNRDYSVFIHLVSPGGELIGQANYLLGGWLYPTSRWPKGHLAATPSLIFIPPEAQPGPYRLQVGSYQAESGERLLVRNGPNADQEFSLLSTIIVAP